MTAFWKGDAEVKGDNYEKGIVKVESSVQWNSECALIQKRHLKAFIDAKIMMFHPIMYVEQTWETLPKK